MYTCSRQARKLCLLWRRFGSEFYTAASYIAPLHKEKSCDSCIPFEKRLKHIFRKSLLWFENICRNQLQENQENTSELKGEEFFGAWAVKFDSFHSNREHSLEKGRFLMENMNSLAQFSGWITILVITRKNMNKSFYFALVYIAWHH